MTIFLVVSVGGDELQNTPSLSLLRTGQISCYDSQGQVINFSGSHQDGEYQRGLVWPVPRFIHNGDGTITDTLTKLMWLKDSNCFGSVGWHVSRQQILALNSGVLEPQCHDYHAQHTDWRVPEVGELETLLDAEELMPAHYLKLSGFTEVQENPYWTNTSYLNPLNAWTINMGDGQIEYKNKMETYSLLAVRSVEEASPHDDKKELAQEDSALRFVENGDGTVSDMSTGLMWLKNASCFQNLSWQEAINEVVSFSNQSGRQCPGYRASYSDWSLPNRREMQSLIDYRYDFPALSSDHPFDKLSLAYWTSTTSSLEPVKAYFVNMFEGSVASMLKDEKVAAIPVRYIVPPVSRPRQTTRSGLGEEVKQQYVARLDPELQTEIHWPPEPRFFDNGDGTSMDRVTGYTWLTDANCFGKLAWEETFKTMEIFNNDPRRFSCQGYDVTFGDWMVPSVDELREIINVREENSAAWLGQQGIVNIQDSGDYWSSSETVINLYYGYVINFKNGQVHNYPKSLQFFFWPRRALTGDPNREPLLNMTANAIGERITLGTSESFSIAVYLHSFGIRTPADFWFWYETPEGDAIWLSPIRTWKTRMTPVYQGDLFNLKNYEIFRGNTENLAPGDYVFYFAVDFQQNGILDDPKYMSRVIFTVLDKGLVNDQEKEKKEPPKA